MATTNREHHRFGSAGIADLRDLKRAGILNGQGASFGMDASKRFDLRVPGDGSVALLAGSGAGKSASVYTNNLLGGHLPGNLILFEPRGDVTTVTLLALSLQGYEVYFCNHAGLMGLPQHGFNPLDHLTIESPSLIPDGQKVALDFCPTPPGIKTAWTYDDARRWLNELILADAEQFGCASLPTLYDKVLSIQGDLDAWGGYLDRMVQSRIRTVGAFANEIMQLQREGKESFAAPMSVLLNAFSFMRDPRLQAMFNGADFSLQWLTDPNRKMAVIVTWPIEYIQTQSPAIRTVIGTVIQHKQRAPGSAPVSVLIDEAGQLASKGFESLRELYTFGRGAGLVSNICAWQEVSQIRSGFGPQADEILGSAQIRCFKGVRTESSTTMVSRMAGTMTLEYDERNRQSDARRLKQHAARRLLETGDFMTAVADLRHYRQSEVHRTRQARALLTPDEVLNLGSTEMVAFASGLVDKTILGHWVNHFERRDFRGRYLNNPYFDERVRIAGRFGRHRMVEVIEEAVPERLAHLPQYAAGTWRYVKGYRPRVGH